MLSEAIRLLCLLVLLNFIGCKAKQLDVNLSEIQKCFMELNNEIQTKLDKSNPLLCRFPSKTRKKFKLPELSGIITSVGSSTVGSTSTPGMFKLDCDDMDTGELQRKEIDDLMNFLDFVRHTGDNFDEYIDCVNKSSGMDSEIAAGLIHGVYSNFYIQLVLALKETLDRGSGGAKCTTPEECGKGKCEKEVCVCEDTHTGQRCHIVIDKTLDLNLCASVPCKNGATCKTHDGEISCMCAEGFRGEKCLIEITWDDCKDDFSATTEPVHRLINKLNCLRKFPNVEKLLKDYQQTISGQENNPEACSGDTLTEDKAVEKAKEIIEAVTKQLRDEIAEETGYLKACAARHGNESEAEALTEPMYSLTRMFNVLINEVNPEFDREQCKTIFKNMMETAEEYALQVICELNQLEEYRALIDQLGLRDIFEEPSSELDCDKYEMTKETAKTDVKAIIKEASRYVTRDMANGYRQLVACLQDQAQEDEFVAMALNFMENAGKVIEELFETLIPGPCISTPCMNDATCHNVGSTYWCQCQDRNTGRNCELDKNDVELGECKKAFQETIGEANAMAVKFVCTAKDVEDLADLVDTLSLKVIVEDVDCMKTKQPQDDVETILRQILARAKVFVEQTLPGAYEKMLMCLSDVTGPGEVQEWNMAVFQKEIENIRIVLEQLSEALNQGPCSSNPCRSGGTCLRVGTGYKCVCPANYAGGQCQRDLCEGKRNKCGFCVRGLDENTGINKCGGCSNNPDDPQPDCNNDCGGTAVMHKFCRRCYGGNTGVPLSDVYDCRRCVIKGKSNRDCAGNCLQTDKQAAYWNKCDVCVGGGTGVEKRSGMDVCGVCDGDGTTCNDCTGVPNGKAQLDDCGVCDGRNECVKVLRCDPNGILVGSETKVVINGVGLTGESPRLVAWKGPTDAGVSLIVMETEAPENVTVTVPDTLPPGRYIVRYSPTATAPFTESEAQLVVINPEVVRLLDVSPASITLQRDGTTEVTLTGEGLPPVQLMCLYKDPSGKRYLIAKATGGGNERKCRINHPKRSGDLTVSLSMDGTTPLGGAVNIRFTSPSPVCKLGFNSIGDGICLKCDVPLSMEHLGSASDIFIDSSPLGDSLISEIPKRPSKMVCVYKVDLRAAGRSVTLKPNAVKASGLYTTAASGSLIVAAMEDPPKPDATMAGQFNVGSCSEVTLYHAYPSQGRRGRDLTYTHSVEPSEGVTIEGEGTPSIILVGLSPGQDYTVTQTVCNQAGDCSTDVKVVSKKATPAPDVTIDVDVNPKHVLRSSRITLTAKIQHPSCSERTALTSSWSVSRSDVIISSKDRPQNIVRPYSLPLGATTFSVTVVSATNPEVSTTSSITLHVVSSPLEVAIIGSSSRTVGVDSKSLLLEGVVRDPDVAKTDQGEITRTWECVPADDLRQPCPELTIPVERDTVVVSPGLYTAGDSFRFIYTASSGFGESRKTTSRSVIVDFVEGAPCDVELSTDKTYYSATEAVLITARCKTREAVMFEWTSFDGEKGSSETGEGDTSVSYDYFEINDETAVVSKASLSEKKDFYQSRLQIKKGVLNSGSTYKFVASVIYPNKDVTQSALEIEVSQEIKNCVLHVTDYVAFEKIHVETVKCEGDSLKYEYSAGEDGSMKFLGTGRRLTVIGPSTTSGNSIKFKVKVSDGVTGESKTYAKTVQVSPPANLALALVNLEDDIDSKLQAGNKDDAAAVAALILEGFGESVGSERRKRREASTDLVMLILDAAADVMSAGYEGSNPASILQALTNLDALTYEELTNDQKISLLSYYAALLEMLVQGDNAVPEGVPQKVEMLRSMAGIEEVDEAVIARLVSAVDTAMMSGLNLGDESVTYYEDRVKKVLNVALGDSTISGSDGNCDAKVLSGDSLNTRFEGSVILSLVTYGPDVDYLSSVELREDRTSNILSIDMYDKLSHEPINVAGLSQEVIICLPVSKTIEGRGLQGKYFDPVTKEWLTDGISMSDVPEVCLQEACNMVAIKTSHFTDVSVFATDDENDCLPTSPCTANEYCTHVPSGGGSPNAHTCTCLPWLVDSPGSCLGSGVCTTGDCLQSAACDGNSCDCPAGYSGEICQHNIGTFAVESTALSVGEGDGVVAFTIVRTGGHDGAVDVTLSLPAVSAQAQANQDYVDPSGTKTFIHGETSKTIQISISEDEFNEADEFFIVDISVDPSAGLGDDRTTITIVDNDDAVDQCKAETPPTCSTNERCFETEAYYECVCLPGFTGDPCTFDNTIDRCNPNPCLNGNCFVIPPQTTTCTCDAGYEGDYCEYDIDECASEGTYTCPAASTCSNTPGSYDCPCDTGYVSNNELSECLDLDECFYETDNCLEVATCTNTDGSFTCTCPAGFTGDAVTSCDDINECLTVCQSEGATCVNSVGSHTCTCSAGYQPTADDCEDINDCISGPCDVNAACADSGGSFSCTCNSGWTGNGFSCTDIDECATGDDDCDANAACTDTDGSWTCACNSGYSGNGVSCTDIDECATGDDDCDANAVCTDTDGSWTCACNSGYSGNGVSCTDIDECATGDDDCDANAACTDTDGSWTCACNSGYSGNGVSCTDIDECATGDDDCDANAACTDTDGSWTCACNSGYSGNGVSCTDIDECATGDDDCDANAVCTDTDGSWTCACNPGYSGNGVSCTDIDECATGDDDCDANAACTDTDGSWTCACNSGYSGNGVSCTDIDECATGDDDCDANAVCTDTDGSWTCACNSGYSGNGVSCTDIDECATGDDDCDANAACTDTDGSWTCACNSGYSGNGVSCTDIDECVTGDDDCDANAACTDTDGSWTCACNSGYSGNGASCTDIDECATGDDDCDANAACTDTDGSWTCACNSGYSGNGVSCTDIDECVTGDDDCDANAVCTDTDGSWTCACNSGYSGNGVSCTDIDECATGDDDCDANAACTDTDGSWTCACNSGYSGNGVSCTDIDECVTGDDDCDANAVCTDTDGSWTCACNSGYSGNGVSCTDIDECATGDDDCDANAACTDTDGSWTCACNSGYSGNGVSCTDIDECATGDDDCDANAACTDTDGSWTCACNSGYSGNGVSCTDIDECATGDDDCDTNAACTDTDGSWTCACNSGYSGNGVSCTDINECDTVCQANGDCVNSGGSYTCTCHSGYELSGDACTDINDCQDGLNNCGPNSDCTDEGTNSFSCTCSTGYTGDGLVCPDIDECDEGTDTCHGMAVCINTPGSYICQCMDGYSGNGESCTDINECDDFTDNCDTNAACTNNAGGFSCSCVSGFTGDGIDCTDENECANIADNSCHANADCINLPGSYGCACGDGYTGNGFSCSDINECTDETDNCDTNAACTNNNGGFSCSCNSGFTGDGVNCADENECANIADNSCHANADCINLPGSYGCACGHGYTGNGFSCSDINECDDFTDNCDTNAACTNNAGGFSCSCNPGFTGDGIDCTDENECANIADNSCHANADCINLPGSYGCECNDGYTGNGFSCSDINECGDGTDNCDTNAACGNIEGSFTCTCNEGYTGDGVTCTDLVECDSDYDCHADATCSNTDGSYVCICNEGYSGDGASCSDIDECGDATDNCDTNAACGNTGGSFTCTCNGGYSGNGITCSDIDECANAGDNGCHVDAVCDNEPGSYLCACKIGYSGNGFSCSDIDECADETDNCADNAACGNTGGSFTCTCNEGYSGDGVTCADIDECSTSADDCDDNALCTNTPGSWQCECNSGYTGNGVSCADINECSDGTDNCDTNAACGNTGGGFTCTCNGGYSGDGVTCTDDDECANIADNSCHANAECNNLPGSYGCECNDGYSGNGFSCSDIDECGDGTDNCDTNAACGNTGGGFTCTCNAGYTGDGVTCTDLVECDSDYDCHADATCSNTDGSYVCICNEGYSGDGASCSDIDECGDATDNCDTYAACGNTGGSFTCTCNGGYSGDGISCSDIDECANAGDNGCHVDAVCDNEPGSYLCACKIGYSGDGFSCSDIDECGDGTDNCDNNAACGNTGGSFTCTCNEGYSGDGVSCSDIDECTNGDDDCDTNAQCMNTPGSWKCECNSGYTGNGVTCTDINECGDGTDNCDTNAACGNTGGSFTCTCNEGYSGDGVTCTDNDECANIADNSCHANAVCNNLPGSYGCNCNDGYTGNGFSCSDINECDDKTDNCDTNAACGNTGGSFTCTCNEGYSGDGVTCTDFDECTIGIDDCDGNAQCTNTPGSWECKCNSGYSGNGVSCTDINECDDKTDNCADNAACGNTGGSFTCTCNEGYGGDGVTCADIDECTLGLDDCDDNALCTNTDGSWTCACNSGYTGNGVSCTDINECDGGVDNCNENAVCGNTAGSFTCTCNAGYTGNGVVCNNINECATGTHTCGPMSFCTDTIGSFTCTCNGGYTSEGLTCTDINECEETENNNCHIAATCTNTQGGFTCTCTQNYTGDGVRCIQCIYDCNGVCFGSAVLDCSNTCAGGNTGVTAKVADGCGVCEGDGTSCIAVTSLSPVYVELEANLEMTVNGANLDGDTQCVALASGSTIEQPLSITERTSASRLKVSIEAGTFEVGTYMLKCRMSPTAVLGDTGGTFYVYQSSVSDVTPSAYISGPDMIDMCSDLELKGLSSSGSGTTGLTYTWVISPDTGITSNEPLEGHIIYRGLVAGTTYTVSLQVCTVFDTCDTTTHTVTKSSTRIPTVSIRTTVDLTAAPANTNFELIGDAYASTCSAALTSQKLTYKWTLTGPEGLVVNTETTNSRAYQVRVGDFPGGATITVTLRAALLSDASVFAENMITIVTASRPLVVVVDGGSERIVKVASGPQVFDGSGTMDPDSTSATITYSWTSLQYNPDGLTDGSCFAPGTVTDQPQLSVDVSAITVGYRCEITLTASSSTGKTGSAMSSLIIEAGSSARCFLSNKKMYYVPGAGAMLELTCTSSVDIQDVQWVSEASEGVMALDLAAATAESLFDSLEGNEFKAYLVIAKGFLMADKSYNIEAHITDVNGAVARSKVILKVMKDITGGEMNCPASYAELDPLTVTIRKVAAPPTYSLTYCLMVQKGSTTDEVMTISQKQGTGDFVVTGPKQQSSSGNIFIAEVCIEGGDLCKQFSCTVPTVVPAINIEVLSTGLKADITRHRNEGRPLEAAILLTELYDKTGDADLVPLLLAIATELTGERSMNENSASVLLEVIQSIPPDRFSSAQFTTVASLLNTASDFFPSGNSKLPDRSLLALDQWVANAKGANMAGSVIDGVKEKIKKMQISGLDYGSSRTLDLKESKVTVLNSAPGDSLVVQDGNNKDLVFKFGKSLREKIGNQNIIVRVEAFKVTPDSITVTNTEVVSSITNVEFFNSDTNEALQIADLANPSEFKLPVTAPSGTDFRVLKCKFWDTTSLTWSSSGVQTSVISSTEVQCKSSHFTSYAVVNENPVDGSASHLGWIIGVVCGVLLIMILIIIVVVLLVYRYQRNAVFDISRPSTRAKVNPESGRASRPNTAYIRRSPELDDANNQNITPNNGRPQSGPRPGSGGSTDGLTRHMH